MRPRSIGVGLLLVGVLAASCGQEAAPPDPIPAGALPDQAADPVALDAPMLATDAIDFAELETLLVDAGFVGGTQRLFSRALPGRRRMLARVLVFETPEGAQRYLAWLEDHAEELIGDAHPRPDLDIPTGGSVFEHEPDPCCHNETRIFLAFWSDGSTVFTLEVGGQAAREGQIPELVGRLDAAI